jgi:uncharacterized protein YkwD
VEEGFHVHGSDRSSGACVYRRGPCRGPAGLGGARSILAGLALAALSCAGPPTCLAADRGAPTQAATFQTSPAPNSAACQGSYLRPTPSNLAAVDAATVCLIDRERRTAHLRTLRASRPLQHVAAGQSREMVLGDYFGDESRSGQTPLQRIVASPYPAHSTAVCTAQNIGWGTGPEATPAEMVAAWMHSPPHRQIILTGAFRNIGVGIAPAAPAALAQGMHGATYTVELGTRQG